MKFFLLILAVVAGLPGMAWSLEKKSFRQVRLDDLTKETQRVYSENGVHLAWWIPPEFWEATFAREKGTSSEKKEQILQELRPYSMLAIVQADISPLGSFSFYNQREIEKHLRISYTGPDGKTRQLLPMKNIPQDLQLLQQRIKPILAAAMGNLGQNFYFFTLDDRAGHRRLISPYQTGALIVRLLKRDGNTIEPFTIETPLDALFVPRICPNGKKAHISWKFCPWDGSRLPQ